MANKIYSDVALLKILVNASESEGDSSSNYVNDYADNYRNVSTWEMPGNGGISSDLSSTKEPKTIQHRGHSG